MRKDLRISIEVILLFCVTLLHRIQSLSGTLFKIVTEKELSALDTIILILLGLRSLS